MWEPTLEAQHARPFRAYILSDVPSLRVPYVGPGLAVELRLRHLAAESRIQTTM